jgi:hypothetical protein
MVSRALAAQQLQLDHLPVVDERHRPPDALAAADALERGVEILLAAPQLGDPDDVGLVDLPVDEIQLAAGIVLELCGGGEQDLGQLAALARLRGGFAVARDATQSITSVNGTSAKAPFGGVFG